MRKGSWLLFLCILLLIGSTYYSIFYYRETIKLEKAVNQKEAENIRMGYALEEEEQENKQQFMQLEELREQIKSLSNTNKWNMYNGIATAYSPYDNQSGIEAEADPHSTSTGMKPGHGVIAVDPKKIPYYSEIMVIYPNGQVYKGIAGDTGGALRNSKQCHVDIYKDTYAQTEEHGVQKVIILWKPKK